MKPTPLLVYKQFFRYYICISNRRAVQITWTKRHMATFPKLLKGVYFCFLIVCCFSLYRNFIVRTETSPLPMKGSSFIYF